ncbi:MAG TPA: family 43 glycosylhydrolase [Sphingobacteriaceae bacterium]|nr:family 43 glycosylhydrolase [Sphingobacteriaceae bacterium]
MKAKLLGLIACVFLLQSCSKTADEQVTDLSAGKIPNSTSAACYSNPVITNDGGDPFCFKYNGTYYMYRPNNNTIIYNTSTDLVNWSSASTLNYPSYTANADIWAPEVHQVGSSLYLYYANPSGVNGGRDIMACKLASPTSAGSNVAVNLVGSSTDEINIDPTVYQEGSDYYLLWKNVGTGNSRIRIRQLSSSNGTQFASGSSQSVIFPDIPENPLNKEHPTLIREGYSNPIQYRYFLFFDSGVGDTQDYKVSYATSNSLMGTYTHKGTLMEKNTARNIYSIGGHSVVRDGSNYRWMVYRAKNTSATGWDGRKPCIDRLFVDATAGTATCEPTRTQSTYCPL